MSDAPGDRGERRWDIGLCGTFDVRNYGDLLFPLVAEAELRERLGAVCLHRLSYRSKPSEVWPFAVTSLSELPRLASSLDGLLIGGGFLIRFDKDVAPGYLPPAGIHHPTGYWLSPALIALERGIPLIWNCPGMDRNEIPRWAEPLLGLVFSLSGYAAVRDEPSRAALAPFAGRALEVVPDTAFGIPRLLDDRTRLAADRLRQAAGLVGPYLVVQASVLPTFEAFVRRHAAPLAELRWLVVPIAPDLGDDLQGASADLPGEVRLSAWPEPLLLAELIRGAEAFVGHSLHPVITALACGVPAFTLLELPGGKYTALAGFDTIFHLTEERQSDAAWFLSRLGRKAPSTAAGAALERLAVHWDRVAEVLRAGPTMTPSEVSRFWQALPGVLEGQAERGREELRRAQLVREELRAEELRRDELRREDLRREAEVEELERELSTQRARGAELLRLLSLARAEIVRRDDSIAALLDSTSWRVTAPFRFVGRRLGR